MTTAHFRGTISSTTKALYILLTLFLMVYGAVFIWLADLHLLHGSALERLRLQDAEPWSIYTALFCCGLVNLALIANHYDKRSATINYRRLASLFSGVACLTIVLGLSTGIAKTMHPAPPCVVAGSVF